MARPLLFALTSAAILVASSPATAAESFVYVRDPVPALAEGAVPIDTRPLEACQKRTIKGALCLPAEDFLGPQGRLVGFPEILWVLGTAGLTGAEHVLVAGGEPMARDFVSGILYLAGQARVTVLTEPVARGAGLPDDMAGAGQLRGIIREAVFQAPMRDGLIVLRTELASMVGSGAPPGILDGRGENEYWGVTVRGLRGGHVPGADHLPATPLRAALAAGRAQIPPFPNPVVYGHGPLEGLAYFTLLSAGAGVGARAYVEGWADWAAHTALPADSVTYADASEAPGAPPTEPRAEGMLWPWFVTAVILGAAIVGGGYYLGRSSAS